MSAKPYTDAEVAGVLAEYAAHYSKEAGYSGLPIPRLCATLASLQSRLAAAEAEAERARGLLKEARQVMMDVLEEGHGGDYGTTPEGMRPVLRSIEDYLASRPEGEAADGR